MAQNIKLKRSAVSGKVPTAAQLAAGELAINTADGKLYFERDDATIQTILTTDAVITGSLNLNGPITGSDISIDQWGSVSASLSAIQDGANTIPTLQQVTAAGAITSNNIQVGAINTTGVVAEVSGFGIPGVFRTTNGQNTTIFESSGSGAVNPGTVVLQLRSTLNGQKNAGISYNNADLLSLTNSVGASIYLTGSFTNQQLWIGNGNGTGTGSLYIGANPAIQRNGNGIVQFLGNATTATSAISASYAVTASYASGTSSTLQQVTNNGATTTNSVQVGGFTSTATGAGIAGTFKRAFGQTIVIIESSGSAGPNYGRSVLVFRDHSGVTSGEAEIAYGGAGTDNLGFTTHQGASFSIQGSTVDQEMVFGKAPTGSAKFYWSDNANPFISRQGSGTTLFNGLAATATSASYATYAATASFASGTSSTLQQVTNNGSTTTNDIILSGSLVFGLPDNNIAIGKNSLQGTAMVQNIAIGTNALKSGANNGINIAIGHGALATGSAPGTNLAIGNSALYYYGLSNATAVGHDSLTFATVAGGATGVGRRSLGGVVNATNSTAVGYEAGYGNAGSGLTTYANNSTFIGYRAKPFNSQSINETVIGSQVTGHGNNTVTIGNSSITDNYFSGNISGSDLLIDGWGSISASLASVQTGANNLTLDQVTDNGATTTNNIQVGQLYADRIGAGTTTPLASIHIKSGSEAQLLIETDSPFDAGLGYSAGIRFKVEDTDAYDRAKGGIFFVNNSPNNEDWGRGDLILATNTANSNANVVPGDWRLKVDRAGDVHIKGNLIITGSVTGNSATATDADKLDGQHGSYYLNASNINAGTIGDAYLPNSISSDITGNAATATALTAGNKTISGDLTVTGTVTAQEFHTEFVSASIVFESGSTQFGNSDDDTHTFTGTAVLKTSDVTIGNKPVYASDSSTVIVGTVDTTVSDVAFLDYVLISGANRRAGSLAVTWYNGTDVEWNDTSTYDIGSTAGIEFSPNYNGTDIDIALVIPSGTWTIKGHLRYL